MFKSHFIREKIKLISENVPMMRNILVIVRSWLRWSDSHVV